MTQASSRPALNDHCEGVGATMTCSFVADAINSICLLMTMLGHAEGAYRIGSAGRMVTSLGGESLQARRLRILDSDRSRSAGRTRRLAGRVALHSKWQISIYRGLRSLERAEYRPKECLDLRPRPRGRACGVGCVATT